MVGVEFGITVEFELCLMVVMGQDIRILQGIDKRILEGLGDKDIVGRNTGLAGVDDLTPKDTSGCHFKVTIWIDDDRGFATKLHGAWSVER